MANQMICRLVLRPLRDGSGRKEIVLYHPESDTHTVTGRKCGPSEDDIDRAVRETKAQIERAGHHCEVAV